MIVKIIIKSDGCITGCLFSEYCVLTKETIHLFTGNYTEIKSIIVYRLDVDKQLLKCTLR